MADSQDEDTKATSLIEGELLRTFEQLRSVIEQERAENQSLLQTIAEMRDEAAYMMEAVKDSPLGSVDSIQLLYSTKHQVLESLYLKLSEQVGTRDYSGASPFPALEENNYDSFAFDLYAKMCRFGRLFDVTALPLTDGASLFELPQPVQALFLTMARYLIRRQKEEKGVVGVLPPDPIVPEMRFPSSFEDEPTQVMPVDARGLLDRMQESLLRAEENARVVDQLLVEAESESPQPLTETSGRAYYYIVTKDELRAIQAHFDAVPPFTVADGTRVKLRATIFVDGATLAILALVAVPEGQEALPTQEIYGRLTVNPQSVTLAAPLQPNQVVVKVYGENAEWAREACTRAGLVFSGQTIHGEFPSVVFEVWTLPRISGGPSHLHLAN
jgi:hypothetical protein